MLISVLASGLLLFPQAFQNREPEQKILALPKLDSGLEEIALFDDVPTITELTNGKVELQRQNPALELCPVGVRHHVPVTQAPQVAGTVSSGNPPEPPPLLSTAIKIFGEPSLGNMTNSTIMGHPSFSQFNFFWRRLSRVYQSMMEQPLPRLKLDPLIQPIAYLGAILIMDQVLVEDQVVDSKIETAADLFWAAVLYSLKLHGIGRVHTRDFCESVGIDFKLACARERELMNLIWKYPLSSVSRLETYARVFGYPMDVANETVLP